MMTDQLSCLRCKGEMEAGFVPTPGRGQMTWFKGDPPKTYRESFMFGRQALPVLTRRCLTCGYLESYVTPQTPQSR